MKLTQRRPPSGFYYLNKIKQYESKFFSTKCTKTWQWWKKKIGVMLTQTGGRPQVKQRTPHTMTLTVVAS